MNNINISIEDFLEPDTKNNSSHQDNYKIMVIVKE
jgi:hypothetical protein